MLLKLAPMIEYYNYETPTIDTKIELALFCRYTYVCFQLANDVEHTREG